MTPDGRSVYASNRGYGSSLTNTIAGFATDASSGRLRAVGSTPSAVRFPRGMALSANASELLVAGQGSGNLVRLAVAPGGQPGALQMLGELVGGLATPTTVAPRAPTSSHSHVTVGSDVVMP